MPWETQVRRCAIGTLVAGIVGIAILCLSFASTHWLVLPTGHYYIPSHSVNMGLWVDRACVAGVCGNVPPTDFREEMSGSWDLVLGLMCAAISLVFVGASLNIVVLVSPRKVFTVLSGVFWLLAGVANMAAIIIFWTEFSAFSEFHSWSLWVSIISIVIFLAVGMALAVFACCHRWVSRPARSTGEDPVVVAPPPVVAYRSETTSSDGKPFSITQDQDMQPYGFGGKPYSSARNGTAQSYH